MPLQGLTTQSEAGKTEITQLQATIATLKQELARANRAAEDMRTKMKARYFTRRSLSKLDS